MIYPLSLVKCPPPLHTHVLRNVVDKAVFYYYIFPAHIFDVGHRGILIWSDRDMTVVCRVNRNAALTGTCPLNWSLIIFVPVTPPS